MKKYLILIAALVASVSHGYRDLETGTFLTRDLIGYGDGPNVYCYVNCNPITRFDAFGLADVNIWYPADGFGHASVSLPDVSADAYVSWWPQAEGREPKIEDATGPLRNIYTVDAIQKRTFKQDVKGEGDKNPDNVVYVPGLDESAMNQWFGNHRSNSENKWSSLQSNCSTISYSAMRAGGAAIAMIRIEGENGSSIEMEVPIWTPQLVESYAQEIAKRKDPQSDDPVYLDPALYAKQFTTPAESGASQTAEKVEAVISATESEDESSSSE